ncbi:MAG: bis(5'-nucleosyl)-tetraphosphatase (symmetrical) YqeK [Ruminococcus sp.]|nr:bis(5'-nucleosyl)-tetraphosphatase (symmetrical) YqeK [Ruminococcus sp.]MCD7773396.1 bis(5'-nucleosyl)-tetraphosphatase (symmetrical) YqeK [Ruminococcus sp.]
MVNDAQIKEYKKFLKTALSQKRYKHSLNVAASAARLATRHGADVYKATVAGLLHDVCKEMTGVEQLELIKQSELEVDPLELRVPSMYHAIAGSVFVQKQFNITDEEIISAIRFHTVGSDKMSLIAQIVYLADLISADRTYDGVTKMRRLCTKSISKAMLEALRFQIVSHTEKDGFIFASTARAFNEFVLKEKFNESK